MDLVSLHPARENHDCVQGAKSSYRGLGSLNFQATAQNFLLVGQLRDEPNIRVVAHDKSSLAPEGWSIAFELNPEMSFL